MEGQGLVALFGMLLGCEVVEVVVVGILQQKFSPSPLFIVEWGGGDRLPAPFCLPPLSRFPSCCAASGFRSILHESGKLCGLPSLKATSKKKERKTKRENIVFWVLIVAQDWAEDMGSVSNQEFPGGVNLMSSTLMFRVN